MFLGMGIGYTHNTVNHCRMFISSDKVHINDVESLWAGTVRKDLIRRMVEDMSSYQAT